MSLSVTVSVAKEDNLAQFEIMLQSVTFAKEVVIHALYPPDTKLKKLCAQYRAKLIIANSAPTVVEAIRTKQIRETKGNWVLVMDSDEVVTKSLRQEIIGITNSVSHAAAFALPRRNYSLGYPLKHGGWGEDYVVRLFYKRDFLHWPAEIHSVPQFKGKLGKLTNYLNHHKDSSIEFIVDKTNRYSEKEAQQFLEGNLAPVNSFTLLRKLVMEVTRRGLLQLGILDGGIGLFHSIYQGFSVFISYAKLYQKQSVHHD